MMTPEIRARGLRLKRPTATQTFFGNKQEATTVIQIWIRFLMYPRPFPPITTTPTDTPHPRYHVTFLLTLKRLRWATKCNLLPSNL